MLLLTLRDVTHRSTRFLVVTVLAALVFALLFVMSGMVEQFHREPEDAVAAFGATEWIVPEGISGPFTAAPVLPASAVGAVGGEQSAPLVISRSNLEFDDGQDEEEVILIGAPGEGLGAPPVIDGRSALGAGEAVVDVSLGIEVGEAVRLSGHPVEVVGRTEDTTVLAGLAFVYVTVEEAQQLTFRSVEVISSVITMGAASPPPGLVAMSNREVAQATLDPLDSAIVSIDLVRVLLWIMAAAIIGSVVYLSARERDRDVAVLTAVGASKRVLLASLAFEAVLIAVAATAVAAVGQSFLADLFPLRIRVPVRTFWQLPSLAVIVALAASVAGMRRVAKCDPALAFAGGA